jgi:hypothetical protein
MGGPNRPEDRDYAKEYANFKKNPQNMKDHSARVKARREMVKRYGKEALEGKDIDHAEPLRRPGTNNAPSNWRIQSVGANRDWRKGKKGYDR